MSASASAPAGDMVVMSCGPTGTPADPSIRVTYRDAESNVQRATINVVEPTSGFVYYISDSDDSDSSDDEEMSQRLWALSQRQAQRKAQRPPPLAIEPPSTVVGPRDIASPTYVTGSDGSDSESDSDSDNEELDRRLRAHARRQTLPPLPFEPEPTVVDVNDIASPKYGEEVW